MIDESKYNQMLTQKAKQIGKLKKKIKELSNPDQTESFYKAEYFKLLDEIEEFKQIEIDLTAENEELKQELSELITLI